jgi:tetratricopeptide (TPR) repeat protein
MNSVSLSMIVRDAAASLRSCLESVRGLASEIVIADTGSIDNSMEIAREFSAQVLQIPWNDDFAAARNHALAAAHGDWILSLDADEQLDATAGECFPALLGNAQAMGYQVTIRNYVASAGEHLWDRAPKPNDSLLASAAAYPAYVEHENVRLFRRLPGLYFVGRVHESVGPRLREMHGHLGNANFCIHHFGFVADQATKNRKNLMYREMGRRKVAEQPGDWQAHFELGLLELEQFKNLREARRLFERACALNPRAGVALFFLGLTSFRMGLYEEALKALRKAENRGHKTALVAETRGDACYNLGDFVEAKSSYEVALKRNPDHAPVQAKLCLAMARAGQPEKALARLKSFLEATPLIPELYEGLILCCVFLNRLQEAAEAADKKIHTLPKLYAGDYLRAASLWSQLGNWHKVRETLEGGLRAHPGNRSLEQARQETENAARGQPVQATSIQ